MGVGSARPSLLAHQVWNKAVCSATRRAVTVTVVLGRSAGGGAPRSQSQVSLILAHFASAVCTSPAPTTALARGAMCAYWRLRKGAPHAPQQTVTGFRTPTTAAPVAYPATNLHKRQLRSRRRSWAAHQVWSTTQAFATGLELQRRLRRRGPRMLVRVFPIEAGQWRCHLLREHRTLHRWPFWTLLFAYRLN